MRAGNGFALRGFIDQFARQIATGFPSIVARACITSTTRFDITTRILIDYISMDN